MEKDFPGTKPFSFFADEISFTNEKPETRQKGRSKNNVIIVFLRKEGVSPVLRKRLVRINMKRIDIAGLTEKIRLILGM
ncbi:MAG: hypothetical protein JXN62_03065, partial [Bacteroidales bacterium]|nr:hypothetical protein [Bacteroidales bacterium]